MSDTEREPMVDKRAASRMGEAEQQADGQPPTPPPGEAGAPDSELGTRSSELAALAAQAETNLRNWQRTAADFANYKRRVEQERGESARFASAALIINLLPVFDDLDRAVTGVDANLAGLNWVQGVIAIHRKFANLLQAMGVEEIPATGEKFDPGLHEAVADQPGEDGKVLHVVQKGYRLGEKVVRPAMVIVGKVGP